MSDLTAALLILPALFALVVVLEGSRAGCNHVIRLWRGARAEDCDETAPTLRESGAPYQA